MRFLKSLFLLHVVLQSMLCMLIFYSSAFGKPHKRIIYTPQTELGKTLKRVITQKEDYYEIPRSCNKNLFLNTRWTNAINKDLNLTSKVEPKIEHKIFSPHREFHEILAKRIQKISSDKKYLKIFKPREYSEIKELNVNADKEKTNFVNGHFLTLEGFTKFPKVLITMYSKSPNKTIHRFFLPLEQALLCQTTGKYRNTVALLKDWDAYSHFGLAVIPANAYVSLRVGLTSPQFFPSLNHKLFYKEKTQENIITDDIWRFYKEHSTLGLDKIKNALLEVENPTKEAWRFCEDLQGGSTQFLFAYAYYDQYKRTPDKIKDWSKTKAIDVFEIQKALYTISESGEQKETHLNFVNKIGKKWDPQTIKESHFFRDDYNEIKINFAKAFKEDGILKQKEYEDFENILNEFHNKNRFHNKE